MMRLVMRRKSRWLEYLVDSMLSLPVLMARVGVSIVEFISLLCIKSLVKEIQNSK